MPEQTATPIPSQPNAPQACAVQQGEAVVQIQEPSPAPKNGYFDGDDDDEDGTPVFQSAEEVIRRSAEVRELRAGDVICIVQLVNDEHANEQHARLTSIDDPDAETVLAWEFITAEEAKEAKAPLAAVQQGVQPVATRYRFIISGRPHEWRPGDVEMMDNPLLLAAQKRGEIEMHPLYTHPTQQGLDALTKAARSVLAERARQISAEGYTQEQDDSYNPGVLALHGGLYACHAFDSLAKKRAPEGWQWDEKWWKPKDPRTTLVKACALILAEIERMDRSFTAQAKQGA